MINICLHMCEYSLFSPTEFTKFTAQTRSLKLFCVSALSITDYMFDYIK